MDRVPMVSKSHCMNSRYRPRWVFSPRHTVAMWYRLKGMPNSPICWAANRAKGTVRSNRKPDITPAMVLELVKLLVGLFAALAGKNFQIFQGRGVDRAESIGTIYLPGDVDQPLPGDHRLGRIIAKAF